MKNCNRPESQAARRIPLILCVTALAVVFTVVLSQASPRPQ